MRKAIATMATAAIVLGGLSVALVVQSPEAASAQEGESEGIEVTVPATIEDVLAGLVTDGLITEEQSTQIVAALQERVGPFRGHHGGFGRGIHLETTAAAIGIDAATLREALRSGETIAEVADANNVESQTVIDAVIAEMNANLDHAIEDGKLTTERADEIRADAPDRIASMVNGELERRMGFRGHHGIGPGFGLDLDGAAGAANTSA